MDGTKAFIKGCDKAPMIMFGICLKHTPICGILYQPFLQKFVVGIVGVGCFFIENRNFIPFPTKNLLNNLIVTTSESNFSKELSNKINLLKADKIIREYGAGFKTLSVINQKASIYCYPSGGTSLWDSCAPGACIVSAGGKLTDCKVK